MKLLALLLVTLNLAYAGDCVPTSKTELRELVTVTRNRYFPDLAGHRIDVVEFEADAYFLQAKPKRILRAADERRYEVQINPKLYDCGPGARALEAIIVHELEHVRDYTKLSTAGLAELGLKYAASKTWRARYERATDMKVLSQGLAAGLSDYREWIYQQLTPKELKLKRRYYLTPEEIRELSNP